MNMGPELADVVKCIKAYGKGIIPLGMLESYCNDPGKQVNALVDRGLVHHVRGIYYMVAEPLRSYGCPKSKILPFNRF